MDNHEEEIPRNNDEEKTPTNNHGEVTTNNHEEEEAEMNNHEEIKEIKMDEVAEPEMVAAVDVDGYNEFIWRYKDPSGTVQGPFALHLFGHWQLFGYFDDDFKIWRDVQSEEDSILLNDALGALVS